jgi:hypothetical protein
LGSKRQFIVLGLAVLAAIPVTVVVAFRVLVRSNLAADIWFYCSMLALVAWWVVLLWTWSQYMKSRDRGWFRGRPPRALAGKRWSIPTPSITVPASMLAAIIWAYGLLSSGEAIWLAAIPIVAAIVLLLALQHARQSVQRQRNLLMARVAQTASEPNLPMGGPSAPPGRSSVDDRAPLRIIAEQLKVEPDRLRPDDRFLQEIGTDSVMDDSVDAMTVLLLGASAPPASLDVVGIRTVRDYCNAWQRLHGVNRQP